MPHVFVETNWLFGYAAPAHHQLPSAVELFNRAGLGEFTLHIPNVSLGEARQAILTKCQPRKEADAIRQYLSWAQTGGHVTKSDAAAARNALDKFESSIKQDLANLDKTIRTLAALPYSKFFLWTMPC